MLETVLEQLLLRFLAPYVDGISRDKLRLGVWSGEIELRSLSVKPDAPTNLGNHTLRVKTGSLGRLHLSVPWQRLYSGKVAVVVEALDLEVERITDDAGEELPEAEVVKQMREAKRKAIEARVVQLRDLVRQQAESEEPDGSQKGGFFAKLVRKIIANVVVNVQDARCAYSSPGAGLGISLELQGLDVVSTDASFQEQSNDIHSVSSSLTPQGDGSLYKLLRLRRLGLRMAPAGSGDLSGARYVLHPVSASLRLAHEPAKGVLSTQFELAREDLLELTLVRSQVKHLRSAQATSGAKAARLHKLMVPPTDEETIFQDVNVSMEEYGELYERQLDSTEADSPDHEAERSPALSVKPLDFEERRRMRLLEDALSVRLLARRRLLIQERRQALQSFRLSMREKKVPARARLSKILSVSAWAESLKKRFSAAWAVLVARRGVRMAVKVAASTDHLELPPLPNEGHQKHVSGLTRRHRISNLWLEPSEKARLLRDIGDESKFQRVDVPQRMRFEFQLGMLALDLVDDRWTGEEDRQLLSLALEDAHLAFGLNFATDYHGRDSAEWSLEIRLRKFHAFHNGHTVFKFLEPEKSFMSPKHLKRRTTIGIAKRMPRIGGGDAARLLIASELGKNENVLQLLFDFAPTQLHLFQGIVEEIREFLRAPPQEVTIAEEDKDQAEGTEELSDVRLAEAEQEPPPSPQKRRLRRTVMATVLNSQDDEQTATVAEIVYDRMPKTLGSRERAQSVAKKVYERIPDKLQLSIKIASPAFSVPVPGQGTTMFSLGLLQIKTPEPCKYSCLSIHCDLDDTVLCATTTRGEHFDMFQPVLIQVRIQYSSDSEGSAVTVGVEAQKLSLSLAPQALQMLMSTPFAIAGVMWQKQRPEEEKHAEEATAEAAEDDEEVQVEEAAVEEEQPNAELPVQKKTQFKMTVTVSIDKLKLTLMDSVVPVMVLRMQWLPPGLEIYREREPYPWMSIDIIYTLEAEILNPRNNAWEPLIERFHGGLQLVKQSPQSESLTRIVFSGREQLLVNLKPTTLQRFAWFLPLFLKGLTFERDLVVTSSDDATSDVSSKYRVVNLCAEALELEFTSCHRAGLVARVEPTGSKWELLDKWVKSPYFATALVVRAPGGRNSQPLLLEHNGAVTVPDCGMVAQLLTPSPSDHTQHRMLLLSAPLKLHNQTGLTLHVQFHAVDGEHSEVLAVASPPTALCDAALLGQFPPEDLVKLGGPSEVSVRSDSVGTSVMVLPPNAMASVPSPALIREQGGDVCLSRTWISAKPASGGQGFCKVVEAGAHVETSSMRCPRTNSKSEDVYLVCRSRMEVAQLPNPLPLPTIMLQAPLALVNALPAVEGLVVECGPPRQAKNSHTQKPWRGLRAVVPRFSRVHLHGLPAVPPQDGVSLRLRLGPQGPWSAALQLEASLFESAEEHAGVGVAPRHLDLRQRVGGAAAGMTVEALGPLEVRFSCPYWFVDRSGLPSNLGLGVAVKGCPLPRSGGITLLHANCLEEECQVVLGGAPVHGSSCDLLPKHPWCCSAIGDLDHTTFHMPPNWSVLTLPSSLGRFTFCVQTEDVSSADVVGATCQVVTLRPRLIITNTSQRDVELLAPGGSANEVEKLRAGASREWHRNFEGGDSDPPTTSLRFRPLSQDGQVLSQWSGLVVCSDAAAGSTPFLLPPDPSSDRPGLPQVWSVELAPSRGALAMSIREGSDFVAVNRAQRSRASMLVRPQGGEATLDLPVPRGDEVAYGWLQPLQGDRTRAVEVVVQGPGNVRWRHLLHDVRRTTRLPLRGGRLVVAVARKGTRTVLALEDTDTQKKSEGSSTLQLELKFARIGLSLVEEVPQPQELFYLRLDLVRLEWQRKSELDVQSIKLMISDAQVDCQLSNRADPGQQPPGQTPKSLGLLRREDRPAVLLANCAIGDRPFLRLMLERGATSSRDLVLSQAEVALDALDVVLDDCWLEGLVRFLRQCRSPGKGHGMLFKTVEELAGRPAVEGYEAPPLPSVIQVERLQISQVKLTLWCWLKMRGTLSFLPLYLQQALRVLSFSDELTLEDATLSLPERKFEPHRGSLTDFLRGLASEYTLNLVKNVAVVLGKSSLLNLPRVPMKIGSSAVSYLTEGMGLVAGEAASLLNQLTFDDEYVTRQRRIRAEKHIRGVADGMAEAGRALGEGLEGVLDVVKKPAEGWRSHGFGGAVVGLGQGVASGVFKPISNIGQAVSDIGSGISAQVAPESKGTRRLRARPRSRKPRLLFSAGAAIRPWSELEAELLRRLGAGPLRGVEEVVDVEHRGRRHTVLLLFGDRLALGRLELSHDVVELDYETSRRSTGSASSCGATGSGPTAGRSSSSNSHARGVDLLGALEESTSRILSQAFRPMKGLVHDVQEVGREWRNGRQGNEHGSDAAFDPSMGMRVLLFSELKDARLHEDTQGATLELTLAGGVCTIPLHGAPLSKPVQEGLVLGLRSAVSHADSQANWAELRAALREEHRGRRERSGGSTEAILALPSEAGSRTLEVYEVERWRFSTRDWNTPFLPSDRELSWRWVDASGKRHPHLRRQLTREEACQCREPPCELDALPTATCEWSVEQGEETGENGWRYGLAWRSSTWDVAPGIFDVLRRRKWQRTFT